MEQFGAMRRAVALLAVTLLAANAALAAAQPSASTSFHMRASTLGAPPVIDGIVNGNEWQGAAMATDFIQFQPQRGAPA
jgi:hypothetical protein